MSIILILFIVALAIFFGWATYLYVLHALCATYIMFKGLGDTKETEWYYCGTISTRIRNAFSISKTSKLLKYYRSYKKEKKNEI
jgi:hypothetical protein